MFQYKMDSKLLLKKQSVEKKFKEYLVANWKYLIKY